MTGSFDPTLYLVTDPHLIGERRLVDVVLAAVAGGVSLVQLRDKQADARPLLELALELKAALEPAGVPLIVNDRVDVACVAEVGCHLGQTDLPVEAARALLGPDAILGHSLDDPEQARLADPEYLDYVAFGPFGPTATKPDAGAPVGAAGLARVRELTDLPLVAIGGIGPDHVADAIGAGADGIAVISAILGAADPEAAARTLRKTIEAARERRREST